MFIMALFYSLYYMVSSESNYDNHDNKSEIPLCKNFIEYHFCFNPPNMQKKKTYTTFTRIISLKVE